MSNKTNAICWFEIYVDDMERAKKFYSTVLEVTFQDIPAPDGSTDLSMSLFPADMSIGVGGALVQMEGARNPSGVQSTNTMVYFPCEDCSVEEARVAAAGGKVHQSKFSLGEMGFCSICLDSEGNSFGLHSMQ